MTERKKKYCAKQKQCLGFGERKNGVWRPSEVRRAGDLCSRCDPKKGKKTSGKSRRPSPSYDEIHRTLEQFETETETGDAPGAAAGTVLTGKGVIPVDAKGIPTEIHKGCVLSYIPEYSRRKIGSNTAHETGFKSPLVGASPNRDRSRPPRSEPAGII